MNTKQRAQALMSMVAVVAAAVTTGLNDGVTLEAGPVAAIVAGSLAVLAALGYAVKDNNPAPSSVEALDRLGYLDNSKRNEMVTKGLLP